MIVHWIARHIPLSRGVSSDHQTVMIKIQLSLWRNTARTTTVHYDWSLLNNKDIRDKYALAQRKQYSMHYRSQKHTLTDKYENFVGAHLEALAECIPAKQDIKKKP